MSNQSKQPAPLPIEFLFRFRDLVAPTLEEHSKIIKQRGSCWWGWWKRPTEDIRMEVWDALAKALAKSPGGGVAVGLFDSGSGSVHCAWISQVLLPQKETPGENSVTEVPSEERELVPSYYRESPFSRAWMRITKIDRNIDFFGRYSFAEAPRLPNYSPATLARFQGKVIVDAEELRGMDTTIWVVRLAAPNDPHENILLTTPALPDAVSADVVRCDSDFILHLTDLHFARSANRDQHVWKLESEPDTQRRTLVDAVTAAIGKKKIGLVLITGDLTFTGDTEEFNEAIAALGHLLGVLGLSTDHVVVIPGNHDIQWTQTGQYDEHAAVTQAPDQARANYEAFYLKFFRHQANPLLAMARRYLMPSGVSLEVAALNSSSLETGKNFLAGVGRTNEAAFEETANKLGWNELKTGSKALRVLMIHHHLALTEDLEPAHGYLKGFGLALDAVRIQRMAAQHNVQLALHGHKHRAFLWRSHVFELPENTKPNHYLGEIAIIGGGSAGSIDTDGKSNYFNLLAIDTHGLKLTIYRSQNAGKFEAMQSWRASLTIADSGQLLLGLWAPAEKD